MFNEQVDKFENVLQEGGCYLIAKGQLKPANKEFSSVKNNYEITFDRNTTVQPIGDCSDIQGASCNFVPIANIAGCTPDQDVIGTVHFAF